MLFRTTGTNRAVWKRVTAGYPLSYGQMTWTTAASSGNSTFMQRARCHDAVSILTTAHKEVVNLIDKLLYSLKQDEPNHESAIPVYGGSAARVRERGEEVLDNSGLSTMSKEERQRALHEIIKQVSVHSAIEEMHVYPQYTMRIPNGEDLNRHSLAEHQQVKEILKDLDNFADRLSGDPKNWPAFPISTIQDLKTSLCKHIKEEETHIFPLLKQYMKKGELEDLCKVLVDAKSRVPTRPHPMAPNKPPFINMAGPISATVDKVRDKIRGVQEETVASHASDRTQQTPPSV